MKSACLVLVSTCTALTSVSVSNAQWSQQKSGTIEALSDVVMLDTAKAIAVGRDGSILKTTNSGETWYQTLLPVGSSPPWNSLSFFDSVNGIVVGDDSLAVTTNGGELWLFRPLPGGRKCISALQIGPTDAYVGDDSGWVYHSLDTGRTWVSEKISTWPIRSLFAWRGAYLPGLPLYALTPYSLCSTQVFPTGIWNETILPNFQGLGSEAFSGEFCNGGGAAFIVGVQGDLRAAPAIIRKSLSDTVWDDVSTGILHDGTFLGVSAPTAAVIYVCGSGGMIFKSTDGGDRWSTATVPTTRYFTAICFSDENHGFAVGDSGWILHTSNGGVTSVADQNGPLPTGFFLDQNYPNPFNGISNFGFRIADLSWVTLRVYDLLGREVATLVDGLRTQGTYAATWDATTQAGISVASGTYFYRIEARQTARGPNGNFVATKKMQLLR